MPPTPPSSDDDEDSIYEGSPCASPSQPPPQDKILDFEDASVHQLDMYLDVEDNQHESENADHASTSSVETNASQSSREQSSETGDEAESISVGRDACESPRVTGGFQVLDSPMDSPILNQGVEILEDEEAGDSAGGDEDDIGVVEIVGMDGEEDWFDSDENKVDVESLDSSSSEEVKPAMQASQSEKKAGKSGGKSLLTRASHTFYKAFGMGGKKGDHKERKAAGTAEKKDETDGRYKRLEELLQGQIGTLNGARTGFVDLRLLRPMTERTIEAIATDGKELLGDFGRLEKKIREVEEMEKGDEGRGGELQMKERMLIEAKVRLAEVAADVDRLRHELRVAQKELETIEREEAKRWEIVKGRRERVAREAKVAREGREVAEERLEREKGKLEWEKGQLERVEKGYRDIEGDWA
eukprot:GFKZ01011096.1.p1 GENE.GFKZ01011096.1~~GFKZ01011096.1.p1  ORF type:complete len:414 (+),score=121.22 GFKZ01011096.1:622-1863(+)